MSEDQNPDWILAWALAPRIRDADEGATRQVVDTSCPWVPFGFVLTVRRAIDRTEDARDFWAACIARDEQVDPVAGSVAPFDSTRLNSIFEVAMNDVRRVGSGEGFRLPEDASEVSKLESACKYCCGAVVLLRTSTEAWYVHWHRES